MITVIIIRMKIVLIIIIIIIIMVVMVIAMANMNMNMTIMMMMMMVMMMTMTTMMMMMMMVVVVVMVVVIMMMIDTNLILFCFKSFYIGDRDDYFSLKFAELTLTPKPSRSQGRWNRRAKLPLVWRLPQPEAGLKGWPSAVRKLSGSEMASRCDYLRSNM